MNQFPYRIGTWLLPVLMCSPLLLKSQPFTHISGVQYTSENGLPGSVVYDIIQDSTGFIWFATETGLARFDGTEFVTFTVLDGLPDSEILRLHLDRSSKLWVQCLGEIAYFDESSGQFIPVPLPGITEIFSLLIDGRGNLWASAQDVLVRLDSASPDSVTHIDFPPISRWPYLLGENEHGEVMVMLTLNEIVAITHQDSLIPLEHKCKPADWIFPRYVRLHPEEGLILNNRKGIQRFVDGTPLALPSLEGIPVTVMKIGEDGKIWAGGNVDGMKLFDYDQQTKTYRELLHLLPEQRASDILEDKDGNIWVSTLGNGVFFFPNSILQLEVWNPSAIGQDPTVYSLHAAANNDLWMGGINTLMVIRAEGTVQQFATLNNFRNYDRILQIIEPAEGDIQAVTDLGIMQVKQERVSLLSNISAAKSFVYKDSLYWIGSRDGFTIRRPDQIRLKGYPNQGVFDPESLIIKERINVVVPSDSGFWLGGISGVYHYSDEKIISFPNDSGFFTPTITDIVMDASDRLWVSTNGGGIVCMHQNTTTRYLQDAGLASLNCRKLCYHDGLLMVGTNLGLSILDISDPKAPPVYLTTLTNIDGLPSLNIFDVIVMDQNLVLATSNGICKFPLEYINQKAKSDLDVYFGEIMVDNSLLKQENLNNRYQLDQNSSSVSINFSAIDFVGSKNLEYRYRLEGQDDQWVISRANVARYSTLPFGTFRFSVQVKRTNNPVWPTKTATITFINPPPYWITWWFLTLMGLLVIGIFLLIQQALMKRIENKNLQTLVDEQTRKLLSSNEELERSNKELKEFAYVVSHDLKSPIRTISSFAQLVQKRGKADIPKQLTQYLDLIVEGSVKMNSLVEDLLTYAQIGGKNETFHPINLNFILKEVIQNLDQNIRESGTTITSGDLPNIMGVRHQIALLFQNLIENAIKFRGEDPPVIDVDVTYTEQRIVISVIDNGIGIPEKYQTEILKIFRRLNPDQFPGTGIGLSICQKIMALHDGKLEVQSREQEGSTFLLHFPVESQLSATSIESYPFSSVS